MDMMDMIEDSKKMNEELWQYTLQEINISPW